MTHAARARRTRQACYGIGAALVALVLSACGGATGRVQTTPQAPAGAGRVDEQLMGRWVLTALEVQRDGRLVPRDARGELTYDAFANISIRVELIPTDGITPPRVVLLDFLAKAAPDSGRGELSYIGLQPRVSEDRLVPDAVAPSDWRHFDLQGDVLRLSVVQDGRAYATITWQRAGR